MKALAALGIMLSAIALPACGASHPKTEAALQCFLGYGATRCARNDCNGGDGPVERVDYLGADARGGDIYEVQYQHRNMAFVVSADPGAATGQYRIAPADHYWVKATVVSPAHPSLIYARPQNGSVISACAIIEPAGGGPDGPGE